METLKFERDGMVGWLRLNRPDRLNAFTGQMWRELRELGRELRADPDLRTLVVTGEGRAFSSGIDTSTFTDGTFDGSGTDPEAGSKHADPVVDSIMRIQDAYSWLADAPYATIAAVRGYALGAGLQLALACDIRVMARGTSLGLLELQYGILPDLGGTQRLPRLVGAGKAKEIIFTGMKIDADEAYRIGLCERLVDDEDLDREVRELAGRISAQPPLAVRGTKRAVQAAFELPVTDGLEVEAEGQAVCLTSEDFKEAIAAFAEQRAPEYHAR
ncbi:MAG: enoyl-CoA hydratase/isomerase family protein [Acidimicrobiia bacterium]